MVIASLGARADEMLDVLEQCVRYRLEENSLAVHAEIAELG
jgi:hypothetical protein